MSNRAGERVGGTGERREGLCMVVATMGVALGGWDEKGGAPG